MLMRKAARWIDKEEVYQPDIIYLCKSYSTMNEHFHRTSRTVSKAFDRE